MDKKISKLIRLLIAMSDQDALVWKHRTRKGRKIWGGVGHTDYEQSYEHIYSVRYDGKAGGNAFQAEIVFNDLSSREHDDNRTMYDHLAHGTLYDVRIKYTQQGHTLTGVVDPRAKDKDESWKLYYGLKEALENSLTRQGELLAVVSVDDMLAKFGG